MVIPNSKNGDFQVQMVIPDSKIECFFFIFFEVPKIKKVGFAVVTFIKFLLIFVFINCRTIFA